MLKLQLVAINAYLCFLSVADWEVTIDAESDSQISVEITEALWEEVESCVTSIDGTDVVMVLIPEGLEEQL